MECMSAVSSNVVVVVLFLLLDGGDVGEGQRGVCSCSICVREQSNQQLLLTITAQNSSPRLMLLHSRDHGGDANGGTGNTEDARDASSYISPDTMSPQCKSVLL